MTKLLIQKKTGFRSSMPFVIHDTKGNIFYDSTFTDHIKRGEILKFNLPAGIYNYDGNFIKLNEPVRTKIIWLPIRERNRGNIKKKYKIVFRANKNKCSIYYKLGLIIFDTQFENAAVYLKYGIYFHELGHHYYATEWKADLYATKKMLELGFNPSQIGRVGLETLSNKSMARKKKLVKYLTSNKT